MTTSALPSPCPARAARPGRLGLAVLLSGGFITIFDLFVVNIAIPSMQRTLDASFAQINFIIVAYELAYGVLLIAGSRLGDAGPAPAVRVGHAGLRADLGAVRARRTPMR